MTIQQKETVEMKVLTIKQLKTYQKLKEKTQNSRKNSKTQGKNSKSRHFWDSRVPERCPNNKPGLKQKAGMSDEELLMLTRLPSRALDPPYVLLLELQRNKDTVRCAVLGAEVPGHCCAFIENALFNTNP